jgi:hypothetical protein
MASSCKVKLTTIPTKTGSDLVQVQIDYISRTLLLPLESHPAFLPAPLPLQTLATTDMFLICVIFGFQNGHKWYIVVGKLLELTLLTQHDSLEESVTSLHALTISPFYCQIVFHSTDIPLLA